MSTSAGTDGAASRDAHGDAADGAPGEVEPDVTPMARALDEARAAERHGDVPVGAVVVRDGWVIAARHNERELTGDPTAHAEVLALRDAAAHVGHWRLHECTLYVTLEPCAMCAGAAHWAGLGRIVFGLGGRRLREIYGEATPAEVATVELPPPPEEERRTVMQDSADPTVEAPEDTEFLAEENNDVEEETVAEITSTVSDDANPTTSSEEAVEAAESEGDSAEELVADMRDVEGSDERHVTEEEANETPPEVEADPSRSRTPTTGAGADESGTDRTAEAGTPARGDEGGVSARAGGLAPTREILVSDGFGSYVVRVPAGAEGTGGGESGGARRDGSGGGESGSGTRVGRAGREGGGAERSGERGGRTLGLSWSDFEAVYGEEELEREREARLEERRSRTRGASRAVEWAAFRAAMENYIAEVRPGNQTSLDAAASPFAVFLTQMHARIHRHFADTYIASLGMDAAEGQNDPGLLTTLEVAVNPDGTIFRVGIVRTSGNTLFDFAAFNSMYRAQPFPHPPEIIRSGDGRAWLHWTFERGPRHCGTWNAEPFMLENGGSPGTEPLIDEGPGDEGGDEDEAHGRLELPALPGRRELPAARG